MLAELHHMFRRRRVHAVFAALAALTTTLPVFLPLAVSIVAGDAIAGEASQGTLRYLLARPTGRGQLLAVRGVTVVVFCFAATLAVSAAGLDTVPRRPRDHVVG